MEHGIEAGRLTAIGAGSATPIASNDDHAGRQVNRRIEFEIDFGVEPLRKKGLTTFP
jgi:outer membrane protein OmpA-like peptidoglycan-associated protein